MAPQLGLPGVTDASLTDLLFERVYVIGRSLIDSLLDIISPQKRSRGVMSGELACQAVGPPLPIPSIGESCIHVRSDIPGPIPRPRGKLDKLIN